MATGLARRSSKADNNALHCIEMLGLLRQQQRRIVNLYTTLLTRYDENRAMKNTLHTWCAQTLHCPSDQLKAVALGGDAGFRRYYRLHLGEKSFIATDAPVEHIDNHAFVDIAKRLAAVGVTVPEIIGVDYPRGFLLQSDLGDNLLLDQLNNDNVDDHYARALALIVQMQTADSQGLPHYDGAMLRREMALFSEWFMPQLLAVTLSVEESAMIETVFDCLQDIATAQPQALVHRDFHSRNILCLDDELATIDFQDAVHGPITYDAVSLLKDCYVSWPNARVEQWLEDFHCALLEHGTIAAEIPFTQTLRDFHAMGLQRHIKVLGIFARLSLRDGKHGYLLDLPLVIDYTLKAARLLATDYPIMNEFHAWFTRRLSPIIAIQEWSRGRR